MTPNTTFIRERLVPALLSGKYQQGRSYLRTVDGHFCCLGVATDLLVEDGVLQWEEDRDSFYPPRIMRIVDDGNLDASTAGLPLGAQRTIGISSLGSCFLGDLQRYHFKINGREYRDLAAANDSGCSFEEIAQTLLDMCDEIDAEQSEGL